MPRLEVCKTKEWEEVLLDEAENDACDKAFNCNKDDGLSETQTLRLRTTVSQFVFGHLEGFQETEVRDVR